MCILRCIGTVVVVMMIGPVGLNQVTAGDNDAKVRPAHCAGNWYPGDPAVLAKRVDDLLAESPPPAAGEVRPCPSGKPIAIVSPHAGYRWAGPVMASGFRCLQGHTYKRVVVLAFSHRNASQYRGVDVPGELTAYSTPLGEVVIDRAVCDALLKNPLFTSNPGVDRGEHSLELQLPFLQRVLKGFTLVPLLIGRMETQDYAEAAKAITPWIDEDTLLIASSDFTHFGLRFGYTPFKDDVENKLHELADQAAAPILQCDFDGFVGHLTKTRDTICGRGPISLLLRILSMQGGASGVRAGFDTSGHQTNDWANSVTYQSIVLTHRPGTLEERERDELLKLARRTVTAYLNGEKLPDVDAERLPAALRREGACFVTLENNGRLRGCIGNMTAEGPLYQAVTRNAVSACRDHRFVNDPVTAAELDELDIEISYLTPMKRVETTDAIIVGRHGLLIAQGHRRGVLLPQVAYGRGWTRDEFLAQTCRKAGLPPDAWKKPDAEIHCFEAEVFGEPE
ncbi:MAG: AmmeMemoRadiSam system protein B [Phycisphaerae bacterium]